MPWLLGILGILELALSDWDYAINAHGPRLEIRDPEYHLSPLAQQLPHYIHVNCIYSPIHSGIKSTAPIMLIYSKKENIYIYIYIYLLSHYRRV